MPCKVFIRALDVENFIKSLLSLIGKVFFSISEICDRIYGSLHKLYRFYVRIFEMFFIIEFHINETPKQHEIPIVKLQALQGLAQI